MQNKKKNKDYVEIDLKRVWNAVWHRVWLICVVAILTAVISLLGTFYLITPLYESSAMFYVNNSAFSVGDASFTIDSGDITASKSLVDTYIVILNSRACLNDVIDYAEVNRTYADLQDMITATAVNETEVFEIVVTSPDPAEAEKIANAVAYILPKRISSIVEGTSASIVDYAILPTEPSSPNYVTNTVVGFLAGFILSVVVIVLLEIFDITIRSEEDVEQCSDHPILAAVPDMMAPSKGGYYGYGKSKSKKKYVTSAASESTAVIGKNISFAASEAYKLLRTKLQFSFVDEISCPVIGVSSAMAGEGKSLTSVNLAYSLAQLNKRVLLIDCDMRRPSLATKLPIQKAPGLSNYLTNQIGMDMIIQGVMKDTSEGFDVISSGRNPPNPIELLSSAKMEKAIGKLRESYDYIILDLPPVGEVSDAMVAAKLVDGILLVVRQDYCNTVSFGNAISQFEFVDSRILGIVINCVAEGGGRYGRYGRYGKYKRYYKKYYSKYSNSYASAYANARNNANEDSRRN